MDPYVIVLTGFGVVVLLTAWLPMLLRELPLSLPIFSVLFGIALFSMPGTGPDPQPLKHSAITEHLTELVVIISLMGAGIRLNRIIGWRSWISTWRLLGIAMPLSIAAMALLGWGLVGLSLPAAFLLGAALAPTDPVLASDVQVGPPRSDSGDEVRFSLTSEAGLNDGLAFPFVYLALAMAVDGPVPGLWTLEWLAMDVLWRIPAGIVVGWITGRILTFVVFHLPRRKRLADTQDGIVAIGMTLVSYGLAELVEGYGFIAVFVTALQLRRGERLNDYHERLHEFSDQIERLLMMTVLVLFGGSIAGGLLAPLSWTIAIAGLAILFVIRPAAGLLALIGARCPWRERAVIASFGIRGIGSFYYLAFALNHAEWPEAETIWALAGFVVLTSVLVHGITATPAMAYLDRCRREEGTGRTAAGQATAD